MVALPDWISIGELAARAGIATSALRYYESLGLISSERTGGNQRRYPRATLRRVSVIRAAQRVGMPLQQIRDALATLPGNRTPGPDDWARMSHAWRADLDQRIAELERLRERLSSCIGCGCLSLQHCALLNAGDTAATTGSGARYLEEGHPDETG